MTVPGTTPYAQTRPEVTEPAAGIYLAPSSMVFPDGVEKWRGLVARYFRPEDVNRALWVMDKESGGNPQAVNQASGASGLFQHLRTYWDGRSGAAGWGTSSIYSPEANIAVAAALLYGNAGGTGGWQHWEVTQDTKPYHAEWQALLENRGVTNGWVNPMPGAAPPSPSGMFGVWREKTQWHHGGIDIGSNLELGTGVRAAAGGKLTQSRSPAGGWIVTIDHGGGWVTKYMHLGTEDGQGLRPYAVADGTVVQAGQVIGYMGTSGNAAAAHLHFVMQYQGAGVDPMQQSILEGGADYTAVDQMATSGAAVTPESRANQARGMLGAFLSSVSRETASRAGVGNRLSAEAVQAQRVNPGEPDQESLQQPIELISPEPEMG